MKELRVGIVGYGFIGRMHTLAYLNIPLYYDPFPADIKLVGVCAASQASCDRAMHQAGYEFCTTDYKELIRRDDINVINCCAPNYLHYDILIEAMKHGKDIYCEKPLAMNVAEAREIVELARETGIKNQMTLMYRFVPAMMRAKQLVEENFLGRVFSFRAAYLHSGYIDPKRPMSWRLDKSQGGGGALYDLGSHILDLVRYLLGDFESVYAMTETFIKERPLPHEPDKMAKVEVDDISILMLRMKNGAIGTLEASRLATGVDDELRIEIHGSEGAIRFNLMDPNWLEVYDNRDKSGPIGGDRGFKKIETIQGYPKPAAFPGPKFSIGWTRYHIASLYDFATHIIEDTPTSPNFEDGLRVQEVMEAGYKSAEEQSWISISPM